MGLKAVKYRAAGFPVMLRRLIAPTRRDALDEMRSLYARHYWRPASGGEWLELIAGLIAWPGLLLVGMVQAAGRNGRVVARRHGRSIARQLLDQLSFFFAHGVLPHWYYVFELYLPDGRQRARAYILRSETKAGGVYPLLRRKARSPLNDKAAFAAYCEEHGVSCIPVLAADGHVTGSVKTAGELPRADLFMKPIAGRGGAGAERWNCLGTNYEGPGGEVRTAAQLVQSTASNSHSPPRLLQPRAVNHPALADVSTGALCTVRLLTCLDEEGRPEVIGAAFRMAIGSNVTVDNFHAGGIAAAVDIETGRLSTASNIGADIRLGWLTHHPDTGAAIEGRILPTWPEVKALAIAAHQAFRDRVIIGWDIGLLPDGPALVEGNSGPDLDIIQRLHRRGLGDGRLAKLLAFRLRARARHKIAGA